jgi:origin recognition complex subunit 1
MAPMSKRAKIGRAMHFLKGGGVTREDSDDELGTEDYPWVWIQEGEDEKVCEYGSKKRISAALSESKIVGARMGSFECYLGDTVLLKADGSEAWVGIVNHFFDDEETGEKMANFMWFSTPREIRNKVKKRNDALDVSFDATSALSVD